MPSSTPHVGLFITCLVDTVRPNIGFATAKLLEDAGCRVTVPTPQTCCGQPAFNSGDRLNTIAIAKRNIALFESFDYVVAPSGSCMGTVRQHYPTLFKDDPEFFSRAAALASRCHEITSFLTDVLGITHVDAEFPYRVTYHDSCAGLRELSIKIQPRTLLASVRNLELIELNDANVCCGFGGTFCVKYPDISNKMVEDKVTHIINTKADAVLAGDLGCIMNMAGKLSRLNISTPVYHVTEVLANMVE
ncbi:MAG: Fe-S oxidoreductase [Coxiella sp. (in: Bacteria)]|nr:MAG: Fe-S oxidoreductase [Coxiella sp. (in: g-proteobacteria)]